RVESVSAGSDVSDSDVPDTPGRASANIDDIKIASGALPDLVRITEGKEEEDEKSQGEEGMSSHLDRLPSSDSSHLVTSAQRDSVEFVKRLDTV
ncbi:unnamed protein product, partial [Amoebophrya sp. A25]